MLKSLKRFIRYSTVGVSSLSIDLALLYLFTDIFGMHYAISTAYAFAIATSVQYMFVRQYVFSKTEVKVMSAYFRFGLVMILGLLLVTWLMVFSVETLHWNYLLARIVVAATVGIWNYILNLWWSFESAGKD